MPHLQSESVTIDRMLRSMSVILVPVEVQLHELILIVTLAERCPRNRRNGSSDCVLVQRQLDRVSVVDELEVLAIDRLVKVLKVDVQILVPDHVLRDDVDR